MKKEKNNSVSEIVIKYDDNTEKVIKKGAIIELEKGEKENSLTFEFADMSGSEVSDIILGVIQLGLEIGILK